MQQTVNSAVGYVFDFVDLSIIMLYNCVNSTKEANMRSINKRSALVFGTVFICLIIMTLCLVVCQLGHDCLGENCNACCAIDAASKLLGSFTLLTLASTLTAALISFGVKRFLSNFAKFFQSTLVLLKTKLSN